MLTVFEDIAGFLKRKDITITNHAFGLHYKVTVIFLVAFSLLGTQKQYFGDPIDCITSQDQDIIDTYCWIHSTFIFPGLEGVVGKNVVSHGVGNAPQDEERKYYTYYQWVPLFLFFQAILFYMPYAIWVNWEGGLMKKIILDLSNPLMDEKEQKSKTEMLVDYFTRNRSTHRYYANKFFVCEILNFINVIGQIYFVDMFLGYEFTTYGTDVINFSSQEIGSRVDPMERIFPKRTKCDFSKFGYSGSLQNHDALCVLPTNILNEKIFIFLWFWFIIVAVCSGFALVYRLLTIGVGFVRQQLLASSASTVPDYVIADLVDNLLSTSEWFLLHQLGKNMDSLAYDNFVMELHQKMKKIY